MLQLATDASSGGDERSMWLHARDSGTPGTQLDLRYDEPHARGRPRRARRRTGIADDDGVVVADRTSDQSLAATRGVGIDLLLLSVELALPTRVAAEHRVQLPGEVTRRAIGGDAQAAGGNGARAAQP